LSRKLSINKSGNRKKQLNSLNMFRRNSFIYKYFVVLFLSFLLLSIISILLLISSCKISSEQKNENIAEINTSSGSINTKNISEFNDDSNNKEIESNLSAQILDKEILNAGCDATHPPFEFLQDGQIVGFDIDIIKEIAKRLDKQVEIISTSYDADFKILREGEIDLIISAVPLNKEKESIVDFSIPYFRMNYLLISLIGSEIKVKESLTGKKIGILELSDKCLDEDYLRKFEIVSYNDILQLLTALKNAEVDAVLLTVPIAINILKENKDMYTVLEEVQSNKEFSIVFSKGSMLKNAFDDAIEQIKADSVYEDIYNKWFNYKF